MKKFKKITWYEIKNIKPVWIGSDWEIKLRNKETGKPR